MVTMLRLPLLLAAAASSASWNASRLEAIDAGALRREVAAQSVADGTCASRAGAWLPDWRYMVGPVVRSVNARGYRPRGPGHAYEFGVFAGASMRTLFAQLAPPFLWGLDSFAGLPDSREERLQDWTPGRYRADPRAKLAHEFPGRVGFVAGFFNVSLADPGLVERRRMKPAAYLGIDVDLYGSTKEALDWAFRSGIAVPGSVRL